MFTAFRVGVMTLYNTMMEVEARLLYSPPLKLSNYMSVLLRFAEIAKLCCSAISPGAGKSFGVRKNQRCCCW